MDPRSNNKPFGVNEAGKPSPLVQRAIDRRRLRKPVHEPSTGTLSSDNDNAGGGVSLRPYKAKPAAVMAATAKRDSSAAAAEVAVAKPNGVSIAPEGNGHKPKLSISSVFSQQSPPEDHTASVGSGNDHGQHQHQVAKPSVKSNLTASAKAFVPHFAPYKTKSPRTASPQIYCDIDAINPAGAKAGDMDMDSGEKSVDSAFLYSPQPACEREDAFAMQFADSHKLLGLVRPATNNDGAGASTPGHNGLAPQGSHQLFGAASPIMTTATPSAVVVSSSPTRGRGLGYAGNGLLTPRSDSVTRPIAQQPQQLGASTSVSSWVKQRLANNTSLGSSSPMTQMDDKYGPQGGGPPPPPPMAKAGLGDIPGTPVSGLQMTNTWTGQYSPGHNSPSRLNGLGGRTPNITNLSYNKPYAQRLPPTTKATEKDLADCRQHLINFATQSPLTNGITTTADAGAYSPVPTGYRAGLPGSASESALFYYNLRQPTTPSRRDDINGNNNQVMIAPALSPVATGYGDVDVDVHEEAVVFEAPSMEIRKMRSPELNELVGASGVPSLARLRGHAFPFEPSGGMKAKRGEGVVHYINIPFDLQNSNLMAHVGKSTKILHPVLEGIHITMENVTGKTGEAYVEMVGMKDALDHVERFRKRQLEGHVDRLGDRPVEMEISSPDALLKAVFKAGSTGVEWRGGNPTIKDPPLGQNYGYFKTFVPTEDLTMLLKHAETQTTFNKQCPERPYECMISILVLMPWTATELITIKTRSQIYQTVVDLLKLLQRAIADKKSENRLTPQLFNRLAKSAMLCPGFTPLMKDNIAVLANISEEETCRGYNQPRFANMWLHQYGLVVRPGAPLDVIEYYIALIREETQRVVDELPMGERQEIQKMAESTNGYWGYFWREINYPKGPAFDNMTLAEAARRELNTIDAILQRAVARHANRGGRPRAGSRIAAQPSLRSYNPYEMLDNISAV
ncbi:hypothetical protein SLS62_003370 [Diatrype stigma]|uniref:Uncharacterized protein n=1 Tax=Diatrype stigma TaxID=117547 RepID=A0AAN9UWH4_9PEZI